MKDINKSLKLLVFAILAIVLLPKTVFAEGVTVSVVTNPSDLSNSTVASINAEKDVTTVAEIKQALINEHIDLDDYLVLNSWYDIATDSEVVCGETMHCYDAISELFTVLYLMPIDHTKKEFTLKSIPATDENMFFGIVETNYEMFDTLSYEECNDTFTLCTFMDRMNFEAYDNVKINYEYDEDIKELAQSVVDEGFLNDTEFVATDTELLHYINYGGSLADYTSSFKNQVSNLNFRFEMDQRGGAFEPFATAAIGFYKFLYNDTLYAIKDFMSITAPHIIYVPTDTEDVKAAIEKRLEDIFGDDLKITVDESEDTVNELLIDFQERPIENGDVHYYILTVNDPESFRDGWEFFFIAEKDSSKINNKVSFKSSDLVTNVSVATDDSIPLDTLINVKHITEGEEYSKVISALDVEEGEVFEIKLYSNAQEKNITELENGKFLVSIPVPEKYEGKSLIVYYVDQDDKVTEYEVTVKDGYAVFETDHFSTYTLAIDEDATTNPDTSDNILSYVILFILSVLGLVELTIYTKKIN